MKYLFIQQLLTGVVEGIVIRKYNELELNNTAKELLICLKFLTNNTGGDGKLLAILLNISPLCDNCTETCSLKMVLRGFIRAYDTEV